MSAGQGGPEQAAEIDRCDQCLAGPNRACEHAPGCTTDGNALQPPRRLGGEPQMSEQDDRILRHKPEVTADLAYDTPPLPSAEIGVIRGALSAHEPCESKVRADAAYFERGYIYDFEDDDTFADARHPHLAWAIFESLSKRVTSPESGEAGDD